MEIINLTPHDISILNEDLELVEIIERSMKVARLDTDKNRYPETAGKQIYRNHKIPFFLTKYGVPYLAKIDKQGNEVERVQFPALQDDVIYIVSGIFRSGYDRIDLWQPGELIRDDRGRPVGCVGLSQ